MKTAIDRKTEGIRLTLSFRFDDKGCWKGPLHVCGPMTILYSPSHDGDWTKGLLIHDERGGRLGLISATREDTINGFDDVVATLREHGFWINPTPDGEEAFRALLLFCWTMYMPVHAPRPELHA